MDLNLFDNYSIKKRTDFIQAYISKLIYLIDDKVDLDLENKTFSDFIFEKN